MQRANIDYKNAKEEHKDGIKFGIIAGIAACALMLIIGLSAKIYVLAYLSPLGFVLGFTLISQVTWDNFIGDIFTWFFKSIKLPGLIFSLSLDGIIWFLTVKLVFGIISFMFSAFWIAVGVAFTAPISLFSFPHALKESKHNIDKEFDKVLRLEEKIKKEENK